ncbi:MAG: hypothetical protein KUG49_00515 [Dokdonia sp.]|jgi:hypothetical protein|nr:hypothetical protein [Dokdonia sp.]
MKTLKVLNIILVILLALITLGLVATQSMAALLAIATGSIFLYYAILLLLVVVTGKSSVSKGVQIVFWTLFLFPLIALLLFPEGIIEFLMQGVHLDMK